MSLPLTTRRALLSDTGDILDLLGTLDWKRAEVNTSQAELNA